MTEILLRKGRADAGEAVRLINALPLDRSFRMEVKEDRARRSEQQNRYLWGVCYATILKEGGEPLGGWTAADLHEHFLTVHFGSETLHLDGRVYSRALKRSSKLNKHEFADYIATIQREASNMGIVIPDPDEYLTP